MTINPRSLSEPFIHFTASSWPSWRCCFAFCCPRVARAVGAGLPVSLHREKEDMARWGLWRLCSAVGLVLSMQLLSMRGQCPALNPFAKWATVLLEQICPALTIRMERGSDARGGPFLWSQVRLPVKLKCHREMALFPTVCGTFQPPLGAHSVLSSSAVSGRHPAPPTPKWIWELSASWQHKFSQFFYQWQL